jgi:DNA-binding PadR family transcriptional regulator
MRNSSLRRGLVAAALHVHDRVHDHHHGHGEGEHRRRHGGFGGGFGGDFGMGGPRGWGRGGGRTKRGDTKFLVLEVLGEAPRHGYEIITAIEERRGFRPSAGSIYPTLQMLEEGGFVTGAEIDGKRVYTITDTGRTLLSQRAPGDDDEGGSEDPRRRAKESFMKLAQAVMSARGSSPETTEKILTILDKARREIYAILADA